MKKLVCTSLAAMMLMPASFVAAETKPKPTQNVVASGWVAQNGVWYYYAPGTRTPYKGWLKDGGTWYYLDKQTGAMKKGWLLDGGKWYYLAPSGAMKTGWVKDGATWYYLAGDGAMKTGWLKDGDKWYYLAATGAMKTGWVKDGSTWYYLAGDGAMKTGWLKDGNDWYYLAGDGAMKTGWLEYGGAKYYLADNGKMKTGWMQKGYEAYYFVPSGEMVVGKTFVIDGKEYAFDDEGALLRQTTMEQEEMIARMQSVASLYEGLDAYTEDHVAVLADSEGDVAIGTEGLAMVFFPEAELVAEIAKAFDCPLEVAQLQQYAQKAIDENRTIDLGRISFIPDEEGTISIVWI
ncbi:N-acetylmuramoyl-L-alanine amidase family protein [Ectobacillus antri]|jgi:glucan-binding YG repeat protein|uniref:N-acetylmuramoyl-L-alanine amidase family protein n=1 Tax=Ectobacillus antri TaxID=2486280 RepID=UPI000F5AA427|nr:N-acetylmuramoyl-L-alanine amidase family protein [Ectobacillus antri]